MTRKTTEPRAETICPCCDKLIDSQEWITVHESCYQSLKLLETKLSDLGKQQIKDYRILEEQADRISELEEQTGLCEKLVEKWKHLWQDQEDHIQRWVEKDKKREKQIRELENLIATYEQIPFPCQDYLTAEQWIEICQITKRVKEAKT